MLQRREGVLTNLDPLKSCIVSLILSFPSMRRANKLDQTAQLSFLTKAMAEAFKPGQCLRPHANQPIVAKRRTNAYIGKA